MVSLRVQNLKVRQFMAEFFGTMILVCLGCSANATIRFNTIDNPTGNNGISMIITPMAWSLALTVAIYVSGGISGGHLNPAITLGLASIGKFNWSNVIRYFCAQYFGAFIGSTLTFIVYRESFFNEKFVNSTIGVFGTEMIPEITTGTALVDQIVATAFFLLIICAIIDEKNMAVPKAFLPIAIGFANLGVILFSFGYNCGGPLNPARDLAPRIFSAIALHDASDVFRTNYFWVPVAGCHVGAIIGCWLYKLTIENHWPDEHSSSYDFNDSDGPIEMNSNSNCTVRVTREN
uniref:Aquaporin-9-like n=1 Tax=Dermatophagoides pteronyssinus TaxID=6956 RepID=A0A6P6XRF7_DERPT|nr:aquaporin-9-like [Dermatophagoides pteronyssinus]